MTKQLSMAKRMINACICAYQIHNHGWTPKKGTLQPLIDKTIYKNRHMPDKGYYYNVTPLYQDEVGFVGTAAGGYHPQFIATGKDYINAALVGAMSDGNMVLALRGTIPPSLSNNDILQWIADWEQDFDILPTAWSIHNSPFHGSCAAEKGFAEAMVNLWPHIITMINDTISSHDPTGVIITGHSKGAGMTFLAATLIEHLYPQFKGKIEVHAFAAPAVANLEFQTAYNNLAVSSKTHRYQVENDLVPFIPYWNEANIFHAVKFTDKTYKHLWTAANWTDWLLTGGGYYSVGDFTYFNASHALQSGADVSTSALPAVAKLIQQHSIANIETIAAAHSATDSYLPCFQKY